MRYRLFVYDVVAYLSDNHIKKEKIIAPTQAIATKIVANKLDNKYKTCVATLIREATQGDVMEMKNE